MGIEELRAFQLGFYIIIIIPNMAHTATTLPTTIVPGVFLSIALESLDLGIMASEP
jgi:hypothetical protein